MLQEHDQFIYDDAAFLLTIAFANKALFDFDTSAELQQQQIPKGKNEVILQWWKSALNKPILYKYTKTEEVTDDSIPRSAFSQIFQSTLLNARYFY